LENEVQERDRSVNSSEKQTFIKPNRSLSFLAESLNLNEDEEKRLNEFYKKKSFSKALSSKSNRVILPNPCVSINQSNDQRCTSEPSFSTDNLSNLSNKSKKNNTEFIKNSDLIFDDSDDELNNLKNINSDDDNCLFNDSSKKTRLSYSPISNIDDTLFWLKNQSQAQSNKNFFDNKELSLTGS
jgi:hypothetical protein